MLKALSAIVTAAAIAGAVMLVSAPTGGPLVAGSLPQREQVTLKTCKERAWPYNNCVGTTVGNPKIRLVTTDKLRNE
jgi:hypothetical protein